MKKYQICGGELNMKDNNLTDLEIKKAIECHRNLDCDNCPLKNVGYCTRQLMENAVEMFDRLQAEVENYSKNNQQMTSDILKLYKGLEQAKAENEDYKALYEDLKAEHIETIKAIKHYKAEAYKEFAELLDKQFDIGVFNSCYIRCEIDNLLKELVGEDNG